MTTSYGPQAIQVNEELPSESSLNLTLMQHPCDEDLEPREIYPHLEIEPLHAHEKRLVSSIIPQCPRSETRTMMKHKGKVLVEEHVEKLIKKKPMFKAKGSQKMLEWMKMDSNKLKWVR
jgi:hypothetical protein